mgnify:CR=1 FL=1
MNWPALLAQLVTFLARLFAGPVAAREAGRAAAVENMLTEQRKVLDDQARIAASPHADRDALLERMRGGEL